MTLINDIQAAIDSHLPISMNVTGVNVKALQSGLLALGFNPGDIDGQFGPKTFNAVMAFQRAYRIDQTGVAGDPTLQQMLTLLKQHSLPVKPQPPTIHLNPIIMHKAADIASVECDKGLQWTGMSSEAEKYLAPLRHALRMPEGRFSWCACFVTWCIRQAGGVLPDVFPGTGDWTVAYTPAWEKWARAQGYWYSSRDRTFMPQRGDIALFDWDGKGGDGDDNHIGIVASMASATTLNTLEGNTSHVNQSKGNSTSHKVRGFSVINGFVRFPA